MSSVKGVRIAPWGQGPSANSGCSMHSSLYTISYQHSRAFGELADLQIIQVWHNSTSKPHRGREDSSMLPRSLLCCFMPTSKWTKIPLPPVKLRGLFASLGGSLAAVVIAEEDRSIKTYEPGSGVKLVSRAIRQDFYLVAMVQMMGLLSLATPYNLVATARP
ncbi:hypothetical protein BDY21DRAFT_203716 [Lineolata rhizophorae]|uniref:Uncharacterized protein n=1 Tax=Lineolata rhizophorae TaxID=578093 RepID=A0A6A6P602_9PEZI|nr:hypothetical protein BDY21DRAFT_203716 [Lineolata rhizophorae]